MNMTKPSLEVIRPDCELPSNVEAFFTLRTGGVSAGPYGSVDGFNGLNLGNHVGDSPYCVRKNREIAETLGCRDLRFLNQTHTSMVVHADKIQSDSMEADASWTETENIGCVVIVADCLPILLWSDNGEIVAASHAGWKGLGRGIISETVKTMKTQLKDSSSGINAWMGPRLGHENFKVKQDVKDFFLNSELAQEINEEIFTPSGDGFLFNFAKLAEYALKLAGVNQIYDCQLDTYADPNRFYSYRRDKITGRHGAVIYKKPQA